MKQFYLKFIEANSRMIRFIWKCDYLTDSLKMKKVAYFSNLNRKLFHDLISVS